VALIEACLVELRKCNRLDNTELSVEKALFKSFDMYLQRQVCVCVCAPFILHIY
jgi:hypothetical protein